MCLMLAAVASGCAMLDDYGWVFPTPFPLPAGAKRVPIETLRHSPPLEDTLYVDACPAHILGSFIIEYRPDDPTQPVHYRYEGGETSMTWPEGFSARLNPGLEIVAPDGVVVAVHGVPTPSSWAGGSNGKGMFVCLAGNPPRMVDPP